jgi:tellurite resistance protein
MAKKKNLISTRPVLTRAHLRKIKTFGERVIVGTTVAADATKSRQEAVKTAVEKFKLSERYVWGTVKLGAKMHAAALATVEEAVRNKRPHPRSSAAVFLLTELRHRPRAMKEVEMLARRSGIAIATLRRACKDLGVKKRRTGGRQGHWVWELSLETKKTFRIDP